MLNHFCTQPIRSFLLVLCLSGTAIPAYSQWTLLNSGTTEALRSPWFIDENTGVIVGEAVVEVEGIILKTTDGGTTWEIKSSGTPNALRGVQLFGDSTGYAVGFLGTILKTTDAGETWTTVSSGTEQNLRSIHFPSHDTGYIAGGAGTILKTTDAGATWTPQNTNVTQDLINVRFATNDIGFAVSSTGTFTDGIVIRTEDGGDTWTSVYTNSMGLLGVAVPNDSTIYAGGGDNVSGASYIVRSIDGGDTWEEVYNGIANSTLRGAWFVSPDKGWFVGDLGEMPFTNDGGDTWEDDGTQFNGLLGIHFPTAMVGYAVGSAGTILKYIEPGVFIINPTELTDLIEIYPNPVQNQLMINSAIPASEVSIRVYDLQGKMIDIIATLENTHAQINITALPDGFYTLQITNNKTGRSEVRKFVKQE